MADTSAITKPDIVNATSSLEAALAEFRRALKANGFASPGSPVFQALRKWRADKARAVEMPPYIIATDAVLHAIEKARPKDIEELKAIPTVGASRAQTYGPDILQVLAETA